MAAWGDFFFLSAVLRHGDAKMVAYAATDPDAEKRRPAGDRGFLTYVRLPPLCLAASCLMTPIFPQQNCAFEHLIITTSPQGDIVVGGKPWPGCKTIDQVLLLFTTTAW